MNSALASKGSNISTENYNNKILKMKMLHYFNFYLKEYLLVSLCVEVFYFWLLLLLQLNYQQLNYFQEIAEKGSFN